MTVGTRTGPAERAVVVALGVVLLGVGLVVPATITWALVAAAVLATGWSVRAAFLAVGQDRVLWSLMACAHLLNGLGNLSFVSTYDEWLVQADDLSSYLFNVATFAMVMALLVCLVPVRRPDALRRSAADVALVLGSFFVSGWHFGTGSWVGERQAHSVLGVMGYFTILVEVLVVPFAWLLWTSRPPGSRAGVRLVTLSLLAAMIGDTGLMTSIVDPGEWVAYTWLVSTVLGLVAATWVADSDETVRTISTPRAGQVVAWVVGCNVVLVTFSGRPLDTVTLGAAGLVVVVLLARQVHVASENRRLAERLLDSERHFRTLVADSRDLMLRVGSSGEVTYASPASLSVLGRTAESVVGMRVTELVHPEDADVAARAALRLSLGDTEVVHLQCRVLRPDGSVVDIETLATTGDQGYVVSVRDVTERLGLEARLRDAAQRDALTGLPNRVLFDGLLAERHSGSEATGGLLFCDLDGFKAVNDTAGHGAGDELLAAVAADLSTAVRRGDVLARFGGDEFVVLLRPGSTLQEACELAEEISAAVHRPRTIQGRDVLVGVTTGIAMAAPDVTPGEMLRNADLAMYRAKAAGRGGYRVFEPEMYDEFSRQVDLERRLRRALDTDSLSLMYQPVVDASTGAVVAAEALLRWFDGEEVVLPPHEVVALAESFGSVLALGDWVLSEATSQAARWSVAGYPVRVAVNVSAHQLVHGDLFAAVDRCLRQAGLPPERLTLEITETVLLDETDTVISNLERLRGLGVRLAVDDFGTGYSGLAYLRRLPVDDLKVDRAFVNGLGHLADVGALVAAVVRLGHDLGLSVTAEGVETVEQLQLLREMGVDAVQGYLAARPLSPEDLLACLRGGPFALDDVEERNRLPRASEAVPIADLSDLRTLGPNGETSSVAG